MALRMWGGGTRGPLGFEVKVSRADFLQEVGDPDKRGPLEEACSACYFVAPSGIFRPDELPDGWGWLQLTSAGLIRKKEARHRNAPPPNWLLYVLMKRLLDTRWNDRARRPVVVDVTPELFKFAGLEVTPNALIGEARKMFTKELEAARSQGRTEEAERRAARASDASTDLEAFVKVVQKVTGLSNWEARNLERLEAALASGWNKDTAAHRAILVSCMSSAQNIHRNAENLVRLLERPTLEGS